MDERNSSARDEGAKATPEPLIDLVEQMGITDPRLRMIVEFMRNQNSSQAESVPSEERQARIERVKASYERLKHENMILIERNDILASALGACPVCWGEDGDCEMCRGKGVPGAYAPDKDAFVTYVLPVVDKLRLLRRRHRNVPRDSPMETKAAVNGQQTTMNHKQEV